MARVGLLEAMVQYFTQRTAARTWNRQDSRIPLINGHVRDTINSIHFIDRRRGVAVADIGFITFTEDGGKNWRLLESGTENNLTGVQFTTPEEAWAVGWYGSILHSTDGGTTWEMVSGTTANDLENVQFADAKPRHCGWKARHHRDESGWRQNVDRS